MIENILGAIANLHAAGVRADLLDNYNPANVSFLKIFSIELLSQLSTKLGINPRCFAFLMS